MSNLTLRIAHNRAVYALLDMVIQFACRGTYKGGECLWGGGLSALERAFSELEDCGIALNRRGGIQLKEALRFDAELERDYMRMLEQVSGGAL